MERFFILDKFNTWYNWNLVLLEKNVTPPVPKTNYVDIAGSSGTLDLSESLSGEAVYNDRTVSASFWTNEGTIQDRTRRIHEISRILHGKKIKIIEPDDPDHYFLGRVVIKSITNILPYATFAIECTCDPWRYTVNEFHRRVDVNGVNVTNVVINNNGVKSLCPNITVTGTVNITYNGAVTALRQGDFKISNIRLRQGVNTIGVSGNGSATFKYREATL